MMPKNRLNLLKLLGNLDVYVSAVCLCVLVAITSLGVVFRYILGAPFTWLEEVQLALLVWIGFLSGGAAFRSGAHIAIEMLVDVFPKPLQRIVSWLNRVVVLAMLVFLTIQCFEYFNLFLHNSRLTGVLRIPYVYIYFVPFLSGILMIISFIYHEIRDEMGRRNPASQEAGGE